MTCFVSSRLFPPEVPKHRVSPPRSLPSQQLHGAPAVLTRASPGLPASAALPWEWTLHRLGRSALGAPDGPRQHQGQHSSAGASPPLGRSLLHASAGAAALRSVADELIKSSRLTGTPGPGIARKWVRHLCMPGRKPHLHLATRVAAGTCLPKQLIYQAGQGIFSARFCGAGATKGNEVMESSPPGGLDLTLRGGHLQAGEWGPGCGPHTRLPGVSCRRSPCLALKARHADTVSLEAPPSPPAFGADVGTINNAHCQRRPREMNHHRPCA